MRGTTPGDALQERSAPNRRDGRQRQAGAVGLTDVLLGIAVAAIALPAIVAIANQQTREVQDQVAAQQLKAVGEAAQAYIRDNFATIYQNIGGAGGDFITVGALINTGYLPVNFNEQNGFKQKQVVLLRRLAQDSGACATLPATPPACKQLLEAVIVTTGGTALDPARASHVAVLTGAHAGTIVDGSTARGAYGSWCVDLNLFRTTPATATTCAATDTRPSNSNALSNGNYTYGQPAPGGLALAMFFNGGVLMSEYLNRFNTGNPEDNTMHTALNMDGNDIAAAKTVGAQVVQIAGVTQGLEAQRMGMINDLYGGTYSANAGTLNAQAFDAQTRVLAPTFADAANPGQFYVKPAGASQVQSLTAAGAVTADQIFSNAYYHTSDATLKTNVRPIDDPLGLVGRLAGHRFNWKADGTPDIGFIAQEVQGVLPEAVGHAPNGKLTVKYDIMAAPLVEAVKALSHRINVIEAERRRAADLASR